MGLINKFHIDILGDIFMYPSFPCKLCLPSNMDTVSSDPKYHRNISIGTKIANLYEMGSATFELKYMMNNLR